jgi:hypothetical protein
MAPSDSEDDNLEDLEYDGDDDPDQDVDDEPLDGGADDATEAEDVCFSEWDCKLVLTLSVARFQARTRTMDQRKRRTRNPSLLVRQQWM